MRTVYRGCPLYARFRHSHVPSPSAVTLTRLSPLSLSSLLSPVHAAVGSYTPQKLAGGACKCSDSRCRVVATTANPSPSRCCSYYSRKGARSRFADIKETFYGSELRNDVYTRRLSDFYERKPDIVLPWFLCDALSITAHRVANFILGIKYHLISFQIIEIINRAILSFSDLFLVKLSWY